MENNDTSKIRAEVIEKFINLECLINAIITQHYFKTVNKNFIMEFLYDEYCSFGLKKRVLEKIIKDLDKRKIERLNRLNTIRNYFAHRDLSYVKVVDKECWAPDPRKPEKSINFDALYKEFIENESEVLNYLFSIFESMGGIFSDKI
jgi:hypothetical protein